MCEYIIYGDLSRNFACEAQAHKLHASKSNLMFQHKMIPWSPKQIVLLS